VDDSEATREALATHLEIAGYRVTALGSARHALLVMGALDFRPCVVLADLIMPQMDGLALRKEMLKHPELAKIPAIALTGHEGLRRHALESGFGAALLKPCSLDHLLSLIVRHCGATERTNLGSGRSQSSPGRWIGRNPERSDSASSRQ